MPVVMLVATLVSSAVPAEPAVATPTARIAQARAFIRSLDYDKVIPITESLLAKRDLEPELRIEVFWLHGSCLAVTGRTTDAETTFRSLLRTAPDYAPPADTSPRIRSVFDKVLVEERAIRAATEEIRLRQLRAQMSLRPDEPANGKGGEPIRFTYRLRDPRGVADRLRLYYKRHDQALFSSIALETTPDARWVGEIAGEWTASTNGFELLYYVQATDADDRTLLEHGTADAPQRMPVLAGDVERAAPLYESPWFWVIGAASAIAIGAGGYGIYRALEDPSGVPGRVSAL